MKWAGAALSLLLTACASAPYKPPISAPAQHIALHELVTRSTAVPNAPEQIFLYDPIKRSAYDLSQEATMEKVTFNSRQYCTVMWNAPLLYDIHTHPLKSAQDLKQQVEGSIERMLLPSVEADRRFIRLTPSVTDIKGLVRRTEEFRLRKEYNREKGNIRFFIATQDNGPVLVEYGLKRTGTVEEVAREYEGLLARHRSGDPEAFRDIVNAQSTYVTITVHRMGDDPAGK